jgi:2'-phosphotransferase
MPGKKGVISGMRTSCEVVIEINMVKAIYEGNIPFFISENKVILTPGNESGSLPPMYFRTMLDFKKKEFIHKAPFDYICVYDFEC